MCIGACHPHDGGHHDRVAPADDRRSPHPELFPSHRRVLHPLRRGLRPALRAVAGRPGARPDSGLPAPTSRPPAAHQRERLAACAALLHARCTHRMPRVARRADRRPSAPARAYACAPPRSPPAASFNPQARSAQRLSSTDCIRNAHAPRTAESVTPQHRPCAVSTPNTILYVRRHLLRVTCASVPCLRVGSSGRFA
jgi:hypothetical protein